MSLIRTVFHNKNTIGFNISQKALILFIMFIWISSIIFGISKKSSIHGKVFFNAEKKKDIFNIPGVKITLKSKDSIKIIETDIKGFFYFNSLIPQKYLLKAELSGFSTIYKIIDLKKGEEQKHVIKMGIAKRRCEEIWILSKNKGDLDGIVYAVDGVAIPGIKISIKSRAFEKTSYSNENGKYLFAHIKPGKYQLIFEFPGIKSKSLKVNIEKSKRLRLKTTFNILPWKNAVK